MKIKIDTRDQHIPAGTVHGEGVKTDGRRQLFAFQNPAPGRRWTLNSYVSVKLGLAKVKITHVEPV